MGRMTTDLSPYDLGCVLKDLLGEIGNTTRNYPPSYQTAHILVGMGLAEYADPFVEGKTYWLRLTESGRTALASGQGGGT